jgi:hypothetical protein
MHVLCRKVSRKQLKMKMKEEKQTLIQQNQKNLHLYLSPKRQKVLRQCSNPARNFQLPCQPGQVQYIFVPPAPQRKEGCYTISLSFCVSVILIA